MPTKSSLVLGLLLATLSCGPTLYDSEPPSLAPNSGSRSNGDPVGTISPSEPDDDEPAPPKSDEPPGMEPPAAPRPPGVTLWESSAWSNGRSRTLTSSHDFDPFDDRVEVAAGESRKLILRGDGVATLEGNRSRIYIHADHRDAELVFEASATDRRLENISTKMRSRHNEGGSEDNRFGGYGVSFNLAEQNVDFKIEPYHNVHEDGRAFDLPRPLEYDRFYRYRVTIESAENDTKAIVKAFIDYDSNGNFTEVGSQEYARTGARRNDVNAKYFWIRANSGDVVQTGLKLRNARIGAL